MYRIETSERFAKDVKRLRPETNSLLLRKILLIQQDPYRHRRLVHSLPMFRMRFSEQGRDLRMIYTVRGDTVVLLRILERKHGYRDL